MAVKPNYNFEKRQRELAKKKQQDEKRQKKRARSDDGAGNGPAQAAAMPRSGAEPAR